MRKKFEADLKEEKMEATNTILDLTDRLETAEMALAQLGSYREQKDAHDLKLRELEKTIEDQRKAMFDALEAQERCVSSDVLMMSIMMMSSVSTGDF